MYRLFEVINKMKVGEVARANFAIVEGWHITKRSDGSIVYCDSYGKQTNEIVGLTFSNLRAYYTIL